MTGFIKLKRDVRDGMTIEVPDSVAIKVYENKFGNKAKGIEPVPPTTMIDLGIEVFGGTYNDIQTAWIKRESEVITEKSTEQKIAEYEEEILSLSVEERSERLGRMKFIYHNLSGLNLEDFPDQLEKVKTFQLTYFQNNPDVSDVPRKLLRTLAKELLGDNYKPQVKLADRMKMPEEGEREVDLKQVEQELKEFNEKQ